MTRTRLLTIGLIFFSLVSLLSLTGTQTLDPPGLQKVVDSGGPILREQAAYDVKFYRLKFTIDTSSHSITGNAFVRAIAVDTLRTFVLDLNSTLTVDSVVWKVPRQYGLRLAFSRPTGRIWVSLPYVVQKSDTISVEVSYHGAPKVSANPPWDDGFVWKRTMTGEVWAGVACEEEGADVWWPCKDHPSDEPDSVDLYFTVPASLTCISNGRLLDVTDAGSTKTFHWYVSEPINNYCVTFYLGPLQKIPVNYTSVTGAALPAEYWFLPYNVDSVKNIMPTWLKDVRFLEETCGPYPFRAEKYCIVDAPYAGMEHQTCVAYGVYGGYHFNPNYSGYGFDYIHLHELAHEWWGNLVTAKDWSDVWLHEGFATYMEALFVEKQSGTIRYRSYMARMKPSSLPRPIAPPQSVTAQDAFLGNVYYGGAWVLHTLRGYLGDTTFFRLLRRWAYPDPAMESITNGTQCRLATTDDFLAFAEQQSGVKLDWFFNVYLRQAGLPRLQYSRVDTVLKLKWVTPNNLPFYLPVDVQVGTNRVKASMSGGTGSVSLPAGSSYQIDPDGWILMGAPQLAYVPDPVIPDKFEISVYPNPFNPSTTLRLEIPGRMRIRAEVISISGQQVAELFDDWFEAGSHAVSVNLSGQSSGVYFIVVRGENVTLTSKIILMK